MFTVEEILKATSGQLIHGSRKSRISGVALDSRTAKSKELFIAIRGKRFNGHSFILQAIDRGARAILISDKRYFLNTPPNKNKSPISIIMVKNTVRALGKLAHYYRLRFNIPVVAITGSCGKTTTKEMIAEILSRKFPILRNPGTENNAVGVSSAIFNLRPRHKLAVIELGTNHPGEIDRLTWIVQPTLGVITNIGPAHLEFFKNLKGVLKAKLELINHLPKKAKLIINKDDRFLSQFNNNNFRTITFGFNRLADFSAEIIRQTEKDTTFLLNRRHQLVLKLLGAHNVYNALASIAVARNFGMSFKGIREALASFNSPPMRMQMFNIGKVKIINDCYNSNPQSLKCALEFLQVFSKKRNKIVVCGDMLELGSQAAELHTNMGKVIAKYKINFLVTLGNLAKNMASGAHSAGMPQNLISSCRSHTQAAKSLRSYTHPEDVVLIKGSRAMEMEKILECFTGSFTH